MDPTFFTLLRDKGIRPIDVARALNVDKSTVTRWEQGAIPAERVIDVERVTGIPREVLRPDLARIFVKQVAA